MTEPMRAHCQRGHVLYGLAYDHLMVELGHIDQHANDVTFEPAGDAEAVHLWRNPHGTGQRWYACHDVVWNPLDSECGLTPESQIVWQEKE